MDYPNAEFMASFLLQAGADGFLVTTETSEYGGCMDDLTATGILLFLCMYVCMYVCLYMYNEVC